MSEFDNVSFPKENPLKTDDFLHALNIAQEAKKFFKKSDYKDREEFKDAYTKHVKEHLYKDINISYEDKLIMHNFLEIYLSVFINETFKSVS